MIIAGYRLSNHAVKRLSIRVEIKIEWIERTLRDPLLTKKISMDEWHFYLNIREFNNKILKIVVNPQTRVIVTLYFDRGMKYEN